jgi:hypothetical protein
MFKKKDKISNKIKKFHYAKKIIYKILIKFKVKNVLKEKMNN